MKSYAEKLKENWEENPHDESATVLVLMGMYTYARGLEFALECIGQNTKVPTPKTMPEYPADFGKEPMFTSSVHVSPCGKPFCSTCYPKDHP